MRCPHCSRVLDNVDTYDTVWENNTYYDYCMGECIPCNKKYEWVEVFTFNRIEDVKEIKDED